MEPRSGSLTFGWVSTNSPMDVSSVNICTPALEAARAWREGMRACTAHTPHGACNASRADAPGQVLQGMRSTCAGHAQGMRSACVCTTHATCYGRVSSPQREGEEGRRRVEAVARGDERCARLQRRRHALRLHGHTQPKQVKGGGAGGEGRLWEGTRAPPQGSSASMRRGRSFRALLPGPESGPERGGGPLEWVGGWLHGRLRAKP